jgi:PAS domain S-box-containing protein
MTQSATVLIVDDDNTFRKTLNLQIASKGYKVIAVASGHEALSKLKSNYIDLVLLDINMPEMSGNEVLKLIRADYSALNLPVLMLTGSEETESMLNAFRLGANDYLIKHGNIDILAARIETQLSLKNMNTMLMVKQSDLRREYVQTRARLELDRVDMKKEIDHRLSAEMALIQSEKRYKVLYDNTPAMYFSLDLSGFILSVNRYGAYVLGYHREELIGQNIIGLYEKQERKTIQQYLHDVVSSPENFYRWQLNKINKESMPVLVRETARLVENITGEKNILMVGVDISDEHINLSL